MAGLVEAVKAAVRPGVARADVVAVVGKVLTRRQGGGFANDFVAFDDEPRAIGVFDDPFAAQQGHGEVGFVADGQKIDESVRFVRWQLQAVVPVDEVVEADGKAGQFERGGHGREDAAKPET